MIPRLALALALAALLAGAGPADPARPVAGKPPFDLRVELLPPEPGHQAPLPLAWRREGAGLLGEGDDGRRSVKLRIDRSEDGALHLDLLLSYGKATEVERESVRLLLPGRGRAVDRSLAFAPVDRPLRVDRGTPILAATEGVAVAGGAGIVAARYRPHGPDLEVDLILDDAGSHPFRTYEKCLEALPEPDEGGAVDFSALEHKVLRSRITRKAGEVVRARAVIYPIGEEETLPLIPERWPAGARAAMVFTDHADRTDPAALRAVLYGDSRRAGGAGEAGGFLGHGLRLTKSFFLRARHGGLEEPETRALAQEILASGSEVASHSLTGGADEREAVRVGLEALRPFRMTAWIDHEPYTNCEAFSSEGWQTGGRYGIRDLVAAAGIRWIWEAGDVGGFTPEPELVNLFTVGDPGEPDPPVYPLPMDDRLWVFQSTEFYGPPRRLAAALEDAALGRLEAERGLFVGHTYLSASERTTRLPEHLARLAVRAIPGGGLALDPALDAALGRIAARVRAGTLASLTITQAGDRLKALGDVEVAYRGDGSAEVTNGGTLPLAGLTLAVPAGGIRLVPEGVAAGGSSGEPGRSRLWLDLPAGASVRVRAFRGDAAIPFLPRRSEEAR